MGWSACARFVPNESDSSFPGGDASQGGSSGAPSTDASSGASVLEAGPRAGCTTPWGVALADGAELVAYTWLADAGIDAGTCAAESRRCSDGVLSGSFEHPSCVEAEGVACQAPWGDALEPRASTVAYRAATVEWNQECVSEQRVCDDGVLSGSFTEQACSVDDPPRFTCDPDQNVLASVACGTLRCLGPGQLRLTFNNGNATITRESARFSTNFGRCDDPLQCDANPQTNQMDCTFGEDSFSLPLDL